MHMAMHTRMHTTTHMHLHHAPAHAQVPTVVIVEPDSLPNLATNLGTPRCGNDATQTAYTQGIGYAVQQPHERGTRCSMHCVTPPCTHAQVRGAAAARARSACDALSGRGSRRLARVARAGRPLRHRHQEPSGRRLPSPERLRDQRRQLSGRCHRAAGRALPRPSTNLHAFTPPCVHSQVLGEPCPPEAFLDLQSQSLGAWCSNAHTGGRGCCADP